MTSQLLAAEPKLMRKIKMVAQHYIGLLLEAISK